MRVAEGTPLHEPFGNIGCERESLGASSLEAIEVNRHRVDHAGDRRTQNISEGIDLVEDRLLVLLQITVVGKAEYP